MQNLTLLGVIYIFSFASSTSGTATSSRKTDTERCMNSGNIEWRFLRRCARYHQRASGIEVARHSSRHFWSIMHFHIILAFVLPRLSVMNMLFRGIFSAYLRIQIDYQCSCMPSSGGGRETKVLLLLFSMIEVNLCRGFHFRNLW